MTMTGWQLSPVLTRARVGLCRVGRWHDRDAATCRHVSTCRRVVQVVRATHVSCGSVAPRSSTLLHGSLLARWHC